MHRQSRRDLRPIAASGGQWWRFSRYEISGQDHYRFPLSIRPAKGATLERYDPWQEFLECRKFTIKQPPYQSLMKLIRELEYKSHRGRYRDRLTEGSLKRITEWCQQHGPLGILLSQWESIRLAPIRREGGDFTQFRYIRGPGQSIQQIESSGDVGDQQPTVIIHEFDDLTPREEEPAKTWHKFFPSIEYARRNLFQYPIPYSDEFCYLYSERVGDFCVGARWFTGAITNLIAPNEDLRLQALYAINLFRRPTSSVLDFDDKGNPQNIVEAPSLLSAFAEMYSQDLLYGRATLVCACCGSPYVSSAYQSKYCSDACRMREQKRSVRQKIKKAKNMYAVGNNVEQIAAALDEKQKLVQGWITTK